MRKDELTAAWNVLNPVLQEKDKINIAKTYELGGRGLRNANPDSEGNSQELKRLTEIRFFLYRRGCGLHKGNLRALQAVAQQPESLCGNSELRRSWLKAIFLLQYGIHSAHQGLRNAYLSSDFRGNSQELRPPSWVMLTNNVLRLGPRSGASKEENKKQTKKAAVQDSEACAQKSAFALLSVKAKSQNSNKIYMLKLCS
ncbi:hypothetical protein WN944_003241 [Citrus x changshan-huyou]|uniref:Uncharacterized protein n=1 Tax=Citrus x changshan-huyou TaxID=2935761 RepID=A0AAP0LYU1_9ROSI